MRLAYWFAGTPSGTSPSRSTDTGRSGSTLTAGHCPTSRSFPLLPWSERAVAWLFDVPFTDAGLAVSWVASLVAAWGIFAIGDHLYDRRVGVLLAVLWAAVPIGIVESMAYTESLFTALASWSLYGVLTRRWLWAAGLAALAGLTRPVGLAVVAAVTVTAVVVVLREPKPTWRLAAGALIAPLGWLGYVAWVGVELGSPRAYFAVTDGWGNGFDGGIAFARWVWALLSGSSFLSGALVCLALALLALLVAGSAAYGAFWLHGPGPP